MNRTEQKLKMLFTKDVCDRITFTEKDNKENMLLETLYCYLANNCKMAQVADELHIHLSTLKYRMAHIQELIGFDPRDYKDRMAFLLSYDLMEREGRES